MTLMAVTPALEAFGSLACMGFLRLLLAPGSAVARPAQEATQS